MTWDGGGATSTFKYYNYGPGGNEQVLLPRNHRSAKQGCDIDVTVGFLNVHKGRITDLDRIDTCIGHPCRSPLSTLLGYNSKRIGDCEFAHNDTTGLVCIT